MRTLHVGVRVADLDRSLRFYSALGYEVAGRVPETPLGQLVMLKLPGDEFVSLELVHHAPRGAAADDSPLSHLVIQVETMTTTVVLLRTAGIEVDEPTSPDESPDFLTAMLADPDGHRIELVQWPPGHPDGMSAADFVGEPSSTTDGSFVDLGGVSTWWDEHGTGDPVVLLHPGGADSRAPGTPTCGGWPPATACSATIVAARAAPPTSMDRSPSTT